METCWCNKAKRMEGWSGSNGVRGTVGIHRPGRSVRRGGQSPQAQDVEQGPPHENSHKKHKVRSLDGKNRTLREKQCRGSRDGAREYAEVHVCRRAGSRTLSSTTKRTVPPLLLVHCRRMLPVDAQPKLLFQDPTQVEGTENTASEVRRGSWILAMGIECLIDQKKEGRSQFLLSELDEGCRRGTRLKAWRRLPGPRTCSHRRTGRTP